MGYSSYEFNEEQNEKKKSLIETINDFFKDNDFEVIDDGNGDIGDDGDGE